MHSVAYRRSHRAIVSPLARPTPLLFFQVREEPRGNKRERERRVVSPTQTSIKVSEISENTRGERALRAATVDPPDSMCELFVNFRPAVPWEIVFIFARDSDSVRCRRVCYGSIVWWQIRANTTRTTELRWSFTTTDTELASNGLRRARVPSN